MVEERFKDVESTAELMTTLVQNPLAKIRTTSELRSGDFVKAKKRSKSVEIKEIVLSGFCPSEFHDDKQESVVRKALEKGGFNLGRIISASKSFYHDHHPTHRVVFNANIITQREGKVWYGDLDLTIDGEALKKIAEETNNVLYVLYESYYKFGNENRNVKDLIRLAVWDTTKETKPKEKVL